MALMLQTISGNKNPSTSNLLVSQSRFLKSLKFYFPPSNSRTHFLNCRFLTSQSYLFAATKVNASFEEPYGASQNQVGGNSSSSFDAFLSAVEFLSLASSAAVSVYIAVRCGIQKGGALGLLGSKILVWQCVVLVGGLVAGAVIRQRQWRRVCGVGLSRAPASSGANLLERVEKLEDDLRSSATIIQALSRRLEKLGIRFRLTRKALKEPIAETSALVQKNSEATRALAAQEDILEKELGEIQKVLLAMQEQQQKQLELILAIGKAGKLLETKRVKSRDQKAPETSESSVDGVANLEINQIETLARKKEANNDRP
ncbi:uncharacterized protein LOC105178294 [Sesamum indicum]|uniref:Uncharacterized protein LOC105178294 n=1 Tax=Sesamum indicum TaxID=4182 RepID=A0A6I9UIB3_SESIN|nr:uncharacterized protein LOC105178294 [Sesamum indicum]